MRATRQRLSIYLINLERDVSRRAFMERQLATHGLAAVRVPGVRGDQLSEGEARYHRSPRRSHLSSPEVGCLLSHLRVWRAVASGPSAHALVLEDDVHLAADFESFLSSLPLDPTLQGVHRLETFCARVTLLRQPDFTVGHRRAYRLETNHGGAAAYILNQRTARHLLTFCDKLQHLPDVELFDPARRQVTNMTTYQWMPAPCIQDFLFATPTAREGFGSNLDHDRADRRAGVLLRPSKMKRRAKALVRPLYTALYSLALLPRGRQRVDVRFG